MAVPSFVDRVVLDAAAGSGGAGCVSVLREKFKPLGGPDGGDGGRGGDIVLIVDPRTTTLLDLHRRPHLRAPNGAPGRGRHQDGADGGDLVIAVPDGTVVSDADGSVLADLIGAGTRYVVAAGGHGGLGNARLASKRRRAPGFALLGEPGDALRAVLELKTVADIGLVGYPSAGKSSLIAALSAARPKIADYPFTTLVPNLGVVTAGEDVFTVADVPGLIPGASQGRGLGLAFLRHIERCAAIVHVVDTAAAETDRDPVSDLDTIEAELSAYGQFADRPRLVALNKIDVPDGQTLADMVGAELRERGLRVFAVSAASGAGLSALRFAMAEIVRDRRAQTPPSALARIVLRPRGSDDSAFTVSPINDADGLQYRVRGNRVERWVRQTDFTNDEAVGFLAERLAKLGVEQALRDHGAEPGATVVIGSDTDPRGPVVFDWQPTVDVDMGLVGHGPRGGDPRITGSGPRRPWLSGIGPDDDEDVEVEVEVEGPEPNHDEPFAEAAADTETFGADSHVEDEGARLR